jgi:hypothetical protein
MGTAVGRRQVHQPEPTAPAPSLSHRGRAPGSARGPIARHADRFHNPYRGTGSSVRLRATAKSAIEEFVADAKR